MKKLQFLNLAPVDLEGFPPKGAGIERTFDGALHLKPKAMYELSDVEFAHIQKVRPDLKFHEFKAVGKKVESKHPKTLKKIADAKKQPVKPSEPIVDKTSDDKKGSFKVRDESKGKK